MRRHAEALTRAHLRLNQTALDARPILVVHGVGLQPIRVVPEAVLLEPPVGDRLPHALVGHEDGEHGGAYQAEDEEEHEEEVDVEEGINAAARAEEPQQGDDEEGRADNEERLLEGLLAGGGGVVEVEEEGAAEGREGEEEGHDVYEADEAVAHASHG